MDSKRVIIYFIIILMVVSGLSIPKIGSNSSKTSLIDESNSLFIPNSISGAVINGNQIGFVAQSKNLNVLVTLPYSNQSELSLFLNSVQNEQSPLYHKYLSAKEFEKLFSPSSLEYSKYVRYFKSDGLSVKYYSDRVSISLTGTASQFDNIFNTELVKFNSKGENYVAPDSQLKLSVNYGPISSIVGLNTKIKPTISPMFCGSNASQVLFGSDLQEAYQLKELYDQYGYPTNETIATILWAGTDSSGNSVAPYVPSDLSYYFDHNLPSNEPKPTVYGYPILGAPVPGSSASSDQTSANIESTLDLEMAGSTAPGAKIVEVYGPSATLTDVDQAFASILNPSYNSTVNNALSKVVAISNSWGSTDTNDTTWMQYEEEAAARGITVMASSGDNGNSKSGAPSFPASMAYNNFGTLAVGGTDTHLTGAASLTGTGTTGIKNQSVWYGSPSADDGSEGGVSAVFKEPSWQLNSNDSSSTISKYAGDNNVTSGRGTPDIAAVGANMSMYVTSGSTSGYITVWGTSIASPLTAGLIATVDHSLGRPEGFINPLLYQFGQSQYMGNLKKPEPFYFIYNGSNAKYPAIKGYNLAVGWGSINAYNLVQDQLPVQVPYAVTFKENGLHSGTLWYVNLSNGMKSGPISSGTEYTFNLDNGTYSYCAATNNRSFRSINSSVRVNGNVVYVQISFTMSYKASFSETGLPDSISWYLKINDHTFGPISSSNYSVYLENGSYSFSVNAPTGYVASPYTDSFPIDGMAIVIKTISFIPYSYPIEYVRNHANFNITNYLSESISATSTNPAMVNFKTNSTQYVVNATTNVPESYGNYTINVKKIDQMLANHEISKGGAVLSFVLSGGTSFSYSGVNTQETISTSKYNMLTLRTYISSAESTLSFNNTIFSDNYPLPTLNLNLSSPGLLTISSHYSYCLDGTYSYSKTFRISAKELYFNTTDPGYSTNACHEYNGWNVAISTLNVKTHKVVFNESGLPYNSFWYVNLTNGIKSGPIGVGSTYAFSLTNGTYNFTATNTYSSYGANGKNFIVNGSSSNLITIRFSNFKYKATFNEEGLGPSSFWYVNLTSGYTSGPIQSGSSYTFYLPNGTHDFTFSTSSENYGSPYEFGSISILGKSAESTVKFANKYRVTFNEKGLPSAFRWEVTIGKDLDSVNSSGNSIMLYLLNDSYSFTITNTGGYLVAPATGFFKIFGSSITIEEILFLPPNTEEQWVHSKLNFNLTSYVSEFLHVSDANPAYVQFVQNYTKFQVNGTSNNPESYGNYTVNISYIDKLLRNDDIKRNDANISFYLHGGTSFSYGGVNTVNTITVGSDRLLTLSAYIDSSGSTLNFNGTVFSSNLGLPTIFLNFSTKNKVTIYSALDNYNGNYYYKKTFNITGINLYFNTTDNGYSFSPANEYDGWTVGLNPLQLKTHRVLITENGLPSNSFWYFNLTSGEKSGPIQAGSSYTIALINGTYNYLTGTTNSLYSSPNAHFIVNGNNIQIKLTFAESFLTNFSESGLPRGTYWYLNFTNGFKSGPIKSGTSFSIELYNGTYSYNISSNDHRYSPIVSEGKVEVTGKELEKVFQFGFLYSIILSETNLPANSQWYVNITGGDSFSTATTSMTIHEPNGTYNFTIASQDKIYFPKTREEEIKIDGGSVNISIVFAAFNYSIKFSEINLPVGTCWYVNLSNGMHSGQISGSTYDFKLINGTYTYSIGTDNKIYHAENGLFQVNGRVLQVNVSFLTVRYEIIFNEKGLPSGTLWMLVFNSYSYTLTNTSYSFQLTNGTYSYSATSTDYMNITGKVTVDGKSISQAVNFKLQTYSVTFKESGLPRGTWYVNLTESNGTMYYSGAITGSSYSLQLTNGSYIFIIATNNKIYHANAGSFTVKGLISNNNISVSFTKEFYKVTFKETGLDTGKWYVNLSNGDQKSASAGSYIAFLLENGSYSYNTTTSNKLYHPSLRIGILDMKGNTTESIVFDQTIYSVKFNESNLPSGVVWYVNLTGSNDTKYYSGALTGSSYSFQLTNGTYSYSIATNEKIYHSDAGSFNLKGDISNNDISVSFSKELYKVTFMETGLPAGISWTLVFNGHSYTLTNTSYSFQLTNGTYSYSIATNEKIYHADGGSFTVNGIISNTNILVSFSKELYKVTLTQTGLPAGTFWTLLFNGQSYTLTNSSYSFNLINGTYSYSTTSTDYKNISGKVTVDGNTVSKILNFKPQTYSVTFKESGLPRGTWYVNLTKNNGTKYYSGAITGPSYTFSLTNGTYSYSIATNNKIYHANTGSFTVNGQPVLEPISFSKVVYSVKFTESGLPSGSTWYVNGSMTEHTLSGSTISFLLSNGTYSFSVTNTTIYYATTTHFSITVNGKIITETVTYNHYSYIKGTISPNNANVTINGKIIHPSSTGSFNTTVTAGSYDLIISEKGYMTYYDNFTMTNGITNTIDQNLTKLTTPMSSMELYEIIGTVVGIGAIASAAVVYIRRK